MATKVFDLCDSVRVLKHEKPVANVIAFGGLRPQGGFSLPAFEFIKTLSDLSYNVLFVRDLSQRWFNFGIPGFSDNMEDTATQLARVVETEFESGLPLYMIGNSAGGYAAIYFGEQLAADVVLAICPQTIISLPDMARFGDKGWEQLKEFTPVVPNLRPTLHGAAKRIHVATGYERPADMVHAGNIIDCPSVVLETIKAKHNVGGKWQDTEGGITARVKERFEYANSWRPVVGVSA